MCKLLRNPGIGSKESFPGLLKTLKIQALRCWNFRTIYGARNRVRIGMSISTSPSEPEFVNV
jgi:hypothetical protein